MRARNIKPGLFKDEELALLPVEARYLFTGLWCLADCEGRLEDRPRMIKAEVYPYDDQINVAKVHFYLGLLHDQLFIERYLIEEHGFIQITNFVKHQNPHKNEKAKGSLIKSPIKSERVRKKSGPVPINSVPVGGAGGTSPSRNESRDEAVQMIPDSLSLIPDTGLRTADIPQSQQQQPLPRTSDFPLTDAAVCGYFATADMRVVTRVIEASTQAYLSVDSPKIPAPGDEAIADAVHQAWKESHNQNSAALFTSTVPAVVRNWCLHGRHPPIARPSNQSKLSFSDSVKQVVAERIAKGQPPL